jgi:hypothetical protein
MRKAQKLIMKFNSIIPFSKFFLKRFYSATTDRKMTSLELLHLKRNGKKIAMITAYDYPSVILIKFLIRNKTLI